VAGVRLGTAGVTAIELPKLFGTLLMPGIPTKSRRTGLHRPTAHDWGSESLSALQVEASARLLCLVGVLSIGETAALVGVGIDFSPSTVVAGGITRTGLEGVRSPRPPCNGVDIPRFPCTGADSDAGGDAQRTGATILHDNPCVVLDNPICELVKLDGTPGVECASTTPGCATAA